MSEKTCLPGIRCICIMLFLFILLSFPMLFFSKVHAQKEVKSADTATEDVSPNYEIKIKAKTDDFGRINLTWNSISLSEYDIYCFSVGDKDDPEEETLKFIKRSEESCWSGYPGKGRFIFRVFPTVTLQSNNNKTSTKAGFVKPGEITVKTEPEAKNINLKKIKGKNIIKVTGVTAENADRFKVKIGEENLTTKNNILDISERSVSTIGDPSIRISVQAEKKNEEGYLKTKTSSLKVSLKEYEDTLPKTVKSKKSTGYSAKDAIAYAKKYAFDYNPAYHNFNPDGGDCCNFVSQCLLAGGMKETEGWHYLPGHTASWTSCSALYGYLENRCMIIEPSSYSQISEGDMLMKKDLSHVVICSGFSNDVPLICAHNSDHVDYPLYGGLSSWYVIKPAT